LKLALEAISLAVALVRGDHGDIAGGRAGHYFEDVPVALGLLVHPLSVGPQVRTREKTRIESPNGRTVKGWRCHTDPDSFVVRPGSIGAIGREGAGSEVGRTKNMVQPCALLPISVVKGEIPFLGAQERRVKVVHQGRGKVDPVIGFWPRRFPVNGARAAIPITSPESNGKRVKKKGMVLKGLEEGKAFRGVGVGIQVRHRKGVTAYLHRRQDQPIPKMERRRN
jgi:hypothetical protein